MTIVYSSSDSYSELCAISIVSMLENCKDIDDIKIYVIDKGIKPSSKRALKEMVNSYERNIEFLSDIDVEKIVGVEINVFKWHLSTFSRLFLLHVLPESEKKIIYMDCDMIVRSSLKDLWNLDMGGAWVMGADDCRGEMYRVDIGIDKRSIYINNGLLVINLEQWRKNNVENLFIDFIKKHKGNITYVDQGVLNGTLQPLHRVKLLPIKYNAISAAEYLGYKGLDACRNPVWAYTEDEFMKDIKDPVIVHFTSCFYAGTRPWETKDNHPFRNEFLYYKSLTPWKYEPLRKNTEPIIKKLEYKICKMIPDKILFGIIRVLHSKAFPIFRILKV